MDLNQKFYYDVIIDKEDYCNRVEDIKRLKKLIDGKHKVVIYAPRRYGKSSLVKNIIGKEFSSRKNHFSIYINFMEVQTLEQVAERILIGLNEVLKSQFSFKDSLLNIAKAIKGLSLSIGIDTITQLPSVELKPMIINEKHTISQICSYITMLSKKYSLLIIFDEIQDISIITQASGLLRTELEGLKKIPMILLGSKIQMLNQMFASHNSPFFNFGDEMSLSSITPNEWKTYFNERLQPHKITDEGITYLCTQMSNVPNAICEVGSFLKRSLEKVKKSQLIDVPLVAKELENLIQLKESVFRFQEGQLSLKEQCLLRYIAHNGYVIQPTEGKVIQSTKISSGSIIKMIKRLTTKGWIEFEDKYGYRISDPIFSYFLKSKYSFKF